MEIDRVQLRDNSDFDEKYFLKSSALLVLRSGSEESNLRVESEPCSLEQVELWLRILHIEGHVRAAGRPRQAGCSQSRAEQSEQSPHDDWSVSCPDWLHLHTENWELPTGNSPQPEIRSSRSTSDITKCFNGEFWLIDNRIKLFRA